MVDSSVDFALQNFADLDVLIFVFAGIHLKSTITFEKFPLSSFPVVLVLLEVRPHFPHTSCQLIVLAFFALELLFQSHNLSVIVVHGSADHGLLFSYFLFVLGEEEGEMVVLLMHVPAVLPEFIGFLCFIGFQLTDLSLFVLQSPEKLVVLPGQDIFAILDHLDFLLAGSSEML